MNENKEKEEFLEYAMLATLVLYSIGALVCVSTMTVMLTEDLSTKTLQTLLILNVVSFISVSIPMISYVLGILIITIKNTVKRWIDVFQYYEKLKSDEDKKHLLYNNKSKTKL